MAIVLLIFFMKVSCFSFIFAVNWITTIYTNIFVVVYFVILLDLVSTNLYFAAFLNVKHLYKLLSQNKSKVTCSWDLLV